MLILLGCHLPEDSGCSKAQDLHTGTKKEAIRAKRGAVSPCPAETFQFLHNFVFTEPKEEKIGILWHRRLKGRGGMIHEQTHMASPALRHREF